MSGMRVPRADTIFRLGGLTACVIVALPLFSRTLGGDAAAQLQQAGIDDLSGINVPAARLLLAAVPAATAVLFACAFWLTTRPHSFERSPRRAVALLAVQALIAVLSITDYFFIVAAQAPFIFAPIGALLWLGGQIVVLSGVALALASSGADVIIPEMAGAPPRLAMAVTLLYLAGWQVFAFSVGYLAASERRSRQQLERNTRELMATQQMLADSSRVAERAQISQELHDTLGHSLTVLNVNLELASHLTDGHAAEAISKAQTVGRMLLADVREVVHALGDRRTVDLRAALTMLAADSHSPAIHLSLPESLDVTDPSKAHAIFRCVQESITNAARHARARNLWVELTQTSEGLDVHIADDGHGRSKVEPGRGLKGMRERLEGVGGRLKIHAAPGRGFTIDAWIPSPREQS